MRSGGLIALADARMIEERRSEWALVVSLEDSRKDESLSRSPRFAVDMDTVDTDSTEAIARRPSLGARCALGDWQPQVMAHAMVNPK